MTLFLIDGHAIAYRSYFAFIKNPLTNSKGQNTSAVFGFTRVLMLIMKKFAPDYLAVAFDSGEETERHREYPDYKANRDEMPDDLSSQLPILFDLLEAFGVPVIMKPGFEADDIIATVAGEASDRGVDVKIVTGDKDLFQLLSEKVHIIRPSKGTSLDDEVGPEFLVEKYGLKPEQVVDLLALMGDSSDNIPGVRGIGEKTALKLLHEFGSLGGILGALERVKPEHVKRKIEEGRNDALLSRELVTLKKVPVAFSLPDLKPVPPDEERLTSLLLELEFHQMVVELSLSPGASTGEKKYEIVDESETERLVKRLERSRGFVLDVETTAVDAMQAELVGISFCTEEGRAWYVPVSMEVSSRPEDLFGADSNGTVGGVPLDTIREKLGPVLADEGIPKIGHNIKYDLLVLEAHDLPVAGVEFDTMIASYCLDPERRSHSLDNLALEFCRHRMIPYRDLFDPGDRERDIRAVPMRRLGDYSCEDADYTLRLRNIFQPKLAEVGVEVLFREVEMPLSIVLKNMEQEGVGIDTDGLGKLSKEVSRRLASLTDEIHRTVGEEFNINSNKQLQHVLFDKLGLPSARKTKTGYSTDVGVLSDLAGEYEIARLILKYRQLAKLTSTYIDALPRLVNPRTGRIHTSFNQTVTATGRLSSSDPNLQNIPIRTDLGRRIRRCFVPREENILMDADYSQIELRIMAHLSRDQALVTAFKEGADVHRRTAARIYGIPEDEVDDTKRANAKTINFGVMYGMGPRGLSKALGISLEEAKVFITEYFDRHPGVKEYIDRAIHEARENRYAQTLLGRRRPLPEIDSDDGRMRSFSERMAVNMPIQGTAADMIKIAMVNIDRAMVKSGIEGCMILQVHDELVFEIPPAERDAMEELVRTLMESAIDLEVPLVVDIGTGRNWLEAHR
jgi:DNA polymerase-1